MQDELTRHNMHAHSCVEWVAVVVVVFDMFYKSLGRSETQECFFTPLMNILVDIGQYAIHNKTALVSGISCRKEFTSESRGNLS